jgi:hypothetical protein
MPAELASVSDDQIRTILRATQALPRNDRAALLIALATILNGREQISDGELVAQSVNSRANCKFSAAAAAASGSGRDDLRALKEKPREAEPS